MPKIPLVMLPGLLCDAALWRNQINSLADIANCKVADLTRHETMTALAQAVLAAAPAQFALAGLSMGGYVALEIMRQAPERVVKLCLLDTSARADSPEQKAKRRLLMAMAKSGEFKGVTPRLLPMLISENQLENKELTTTIMAMAERVGRDAFYNQQTAILSREDSRASLKDITCRVQLICGEHDTLTPPGLMREIATAVPQARFDIIPDCGHLSALEKPEAVNVLLRRWLAE